MLLYNGLQNIQLKRLIIMYSNILGNPTMFIIVFANCAVMIPSTCNKTNASLLVLGKPSFRPLTRYIAKSKLASQAR